MDAGTVTYIILLALNNVHADHCYFTSMPSADHYAAHVCLLQGYVGIEKPESHPSTAARCVTVSEQCTEARTDLSVRCGTV